MFKSIKSLLIKDDTEASENKKSETQSNSAGNSTNAVSQKTNAYTPAPNPSFVPNIPYGQSVVSAPAFVGQNSPVSMSGVVDTEIYNILQQALEDDNLPGPDYMELRKAIDNMKNVPIDERTKFIAAFSSLQTSGLTIEKIVESIKYYYNALEKVKTEFEDGIKSKTESKVNTLQTQAKQLADSNAIKSEQITQLTKEINENNANIMSLNTQINEESSKINTAQSNFNLTYAAFVQSIKDDEQKILIYLNTLQNKGQ